MNYPKLRIDAKRLAKRLKRKGYVVVESDVFNADSVAEWRNEFLNTLDSFPEFLDTTTTYVGGGFAALGNPASFHNPFVRRMRQWAMATLLPVFRRLCPTRKYKLEQIHDRMLYRRAGEKPTAESWHRDEAPSALDTDHTFGGWVNLDHESQFFSCVPGSHHVERGQGGFATIPKEEAEIYNQMKLRGAIQPIEIPPGHILIFYEHILHEVESTEKTVDSCRLFLGWRLTTASTPLIDHRSFDAQDLMQRLHSQAIMPLKSGQFPPMYPKLWFSNHFFTRLKPWSDESFSTEACSRDTFPDGAVCELKTFKSGKHAGETYEVVQRYMPSLAQLQLPRYSAYTSAEIAMHVPNREWHLLIPGRKRLKSSYFLYE